MPSLDDIRRSVREVVAAVSGQEADQIDDRARLGVDVGVDSLALTEIALKLESRFGIRFADDEYTQLASVDIIAQRVAALLAAQAAAAVAAD